jgi:hypothetical protein
MAALDRTGRAILIGALCVSLSACGSNVRRSIGLTQPPPDEFLVVSRRPLERPPVAGALPTPQLGAPSRVEPNPESDAQAALLGGTDAPGAADDSVDIEIAASAPSASEVALLSATGANAVSPVDRAAIPASEPESERIYGLDSFFGYEIDQNPNRDEDALASREEAERLRGEGVPSPVPPPAPAE